ncbi:MAG TPA: hypothetical protein VK619_01365 [Pyrinomonadaceae bacterium]|nr:hypothetical protein [Pyrinomonadaceae bacterium]
MRTILAISPDASHKSYAPFAPASISSIPIFTNQIECYMLG